MIAVPEERSKGIASVLGPVLITVSVSELVNFGIWEVSLAPVIYLNGVILFAAGVAIVRFHNVWRWRWMVSVTLIGWAMLLGGLLRLFFPDAQQAAANLVTYAFVGLLCALGALMTAKAYLPPPRRDQS